MKIEDIEFEFSRYLNGDGLAIACYTKAGEPIGKLSVCIPDAPLLPQNMFWAKTWSENELWAPQLLKQIATKTEFLAQSGYMIVEAWELNREFIKEQYGQRIGFNRTNPVPQHLDMLYRLYKETPYQI